MVHALPGLGYHRLIVFESSMQQLVEPPRAAIPLEFAFLGPGDLDALVTHRPDLPRSELERRLECGERCFAALSDGVVVGTTWAHRRNVTFPDLGHVLVVPEDAVYVYDAFVTPSRRGLRIGAESGQTLKNTLAAEGWRRLFFVVMAFNRAGLTNGTHGTAHPAARLASLKLGPLPPLRAPYLPRDHARPPARPVSSARRQV